MVDVDGPALSARFLRGLAANPTGTALRVGSRAVSYEELHELALARAGALRAAGDQPPAAVAVLTGKSVEAYAGILAVLYAGATVVPLHAGFPVSRTRRMLEVSGATAVVADEAGLATLGELAGAGLELPVLAPGLDADAVPGAARIPLGDRPLDAPLPVTASQVAYVLFTSGSTGRPKGVPITYGMTDHYFRLVDRHYDFDTTDVFSQTFDLNFDCAAFDMFCAWGAGAAVQPVPAQAYRDLPGFLAERAVTVWFSAPSAITLIRRLGGLRPGGMPGLRWSLFAGEALRAADVADWHAAAHRSTVANIYGPTELTLTITGHRWSPETSPGLCVNGLVPIGHLHEGHDALLRTPDGELSDHEGELCVTGPQMTPGYLDPADDEGRFLDHDRRRWYRTGDRVRRLANGELIYLGRWDAQVQVNGWRIELAEIEHALAGCPGVRDAVAVTRTVDGLVEIVVYYTGEQVPAAQLAKQLAEILPKGMLPRRYTHLDEFPLNSNRKIDRGRLARAAAS
ncbi:AMP-binding protein [Micromonospora purpureochromogenes]|uniref:Amino acid adenylation domain-containing protein n=1 Tax=Micromonospora purpureochromogenes TaxID=47872 RepID=A0ABX2RP28_9ACTN|nr:AMP-binding protein [Micromonospora purpureochromogenes]NYF58116.1 amino acid adenylation domain-containing protein [Micromonospora purpureochromogenes]